MSKVRINDLARELEVKSKAILDVLDAVGVTEKKTHSSSLEFDEAERVRAAPGPGRNSGHVEHHAEQELDHEAQDLVLGQLPRPVGADR